MKKILSASQIKYADDYTSEVLGVNSIVLMERAALRTCDFIFGNFSKDTRISVVCGGGNNGGDGMAIVRILSEAGFLVKWILAWDKNRLSNNSNIQFDILKNLGINQSPMEEIKDCDLLVDALFGAGLSRDITGDNKKLIEELNGLPCKKLAVDIPSGLDSTYGRVLGCALKCDYTVTFAYEKLGHYLYNGRDYCGKLVCFQIGITDRALPKDQRFVGAMEKPDALKLIPVRKKSSHKGDFGRVLVVAGSRDMAGAAYLCAKAAYISGAGLVKIYTPECNRVILQQLLPGAMLCTYEKIFDAAVLERELNWATSVVMGPGMGLSEQKERLFKHVLLYSPVTTVLDADGITLAARDLSVLTNTRSKLILTPHVGEMGRLCGKTGGEILSDLPGTASVFSSMYKHLLVLKSSSTLICDGDGNLNINIYGNNGMSTGGSGDVLCGIIGGLLAQGLKERDAAILGVYLHSVAGDIAADTKGCRSMVAEDIIEGLSVLLKEMEEEAFGR